MIALRGEIFDVAVDMRQGSPTYMENGLAKYFLMLIINYSTSKRALHMDSV